MNKKRISDIADVIAGINFPPRGKSFGSGEEFPVINVSNLDRTGFIKGPFKKLRVENRRDIVRYQVQSGMVLISARGTRYKTALVPEEMDGYVLTSNLIGIDIKDKNIKPGFIELFLRSRYGRMELERHSKVHGGLMIMFNVSQIESIILPNGIFDEGVMARCSKLLSLHKEMKDIVEQVREDLGDMPDALIEEVMRHDTQD